MPTKAYIGDENGIAQAVTKLYIGDENGIAQRVVKAYIGDENGIAQLCYVEEKAQVTLTGLSKWVYCVIGGNTYNSGDVTLELEIGTPIMVYFDMARLATREVILNGYAALNCQEFHYVVTGNVSISCTANTVSSNHAYKATITEEEATSGRFRLWRNISEDDVQLLGFSYRRGMSWDRFIGSMYNNGSFLKTTGKETVSYLRSGNHVLKPTGDDYSGGSPVAIDSSISNGQTYVD
jgi:hypothetical protein